MTRESTDTVRQMRSLGFDTVGYASTSALICGLFYDGNLRLLTMLHNVYIIFIWKNTSEPCCSSVSSERLDSGCMNSRKGAFHSSRNSSLPFQSNVGSSGEGKSRISCSGRLNRIQNVIFLLLRSVHKMLPGHPLRRDLG